MRVEIVFELNQIQSLASRVAPVPAARAPRGGQQAATGNKQAGGKGGKAAGARKDRPKPKSAEELDAEMSVSSVQFATASNRLSPKVQILML